MVGVALVAVLSLAASGASAQQDVDTSENQQAYVAIVIDDIGYVREYGLRALELPGNVSFAALPHTPHGATLARLAWELGKDVLVHLPMESMEGKNLGPGGLTSAMQRDEVQRTVMAALRDVPHAVGLSNHMGSRLTADRNQMRWVMQALETQPEPFFLDSRTTEQTVAADVAAQNGVRHLSRDVFLDNVRERELIEQQFFEMIRQARTHGSAVAIGHPYPETIAVLSELIPKLPGYGITLVPVTRLDDPPARPTPTPSWQASNEHSEQRR